MTEALFFKFFIALFAISNPFANLIVFMGLTSDRPPREQHIIAIKTAISVGAIFLISTWVGDLILSFFGVSVPSFELAGGIVLIIVGLSMLQAHKTEISLTKQERRSVEGKHGIAVVPLAMPIIAGPGAISTIIIYAHNHQTILDKLYFSMADFCVALFFAPLLYFAGPISKLLGTNGSNILTRIMGLIIMAMAMEMLIHGIKAAFSTTLFNF